LIFPLRTSREKKKKKKKIPIKNKKKKNEEKNFLLRNVIHKNFNSAFSTQALLL